METKKPKTLYEAIAYLLQGVSEESLNEFQNIEERWYHHQYEMGRQIHHCKALNQTAIKYGVDNLNMELLEKCSNEMLIQREQFWMDKLSPEYNSCRTATGPNTENRAKASTHMKRLNQLPWTKERRLAAKERLIKSELWKLNKPLKVFSSF